VQGCDDETGEALVQRPDDTPEAVTQRLEKYQQMIDPLLEFYHKQGVVKIFTGSESNKIYPEVKNYCIDHLKLKYFHAE
jgi:adenylate kinase family enzyme